jgi:hypothetical protein
MSDEKPMTAPLEALREAWDAMKMLQSPEQVEAATAELGDAIERVLATGAREPSEEAKKAAGIVVIVAGMNITKPQMDRILEAAYAVDFPAKEG